MSSCCQKLQQLLDFFLLSKSEFHILCLNYPLSCRCIQLCSIQAIVGGELASLPPFMNVSLCDCWKLVKSCVWKEPSVCWCRDIVSLLVCPSHLVVLFSSCFCHLDPGQWFPLLCCNFPPSFLPCRKLDAFIYDAAVLNYMARKDEGCKVGNASVRGDFTPLHGDTFVHTGNHCSSFFVLLPCAKNQNKKHNKHAKWALVQDVHLH